MNDKITTTINVNGAARLVTAFADTPLLWVLRDELKLTGTKFGCGAAMCGACTVHIDGEAALSCQIPLSFLQRQKVTTIEGLSATGEHPVQQAWIAEQVPQCGYCQSGQIMRATALLREIPRPTREQIVETMTTNLCRCGSYRRIVRAIERVAGVHKEDF